MGLQAAFLINAGDARQARVRVHSGHDGAPIAAIHLESLTLQSGHNGGPEVVADLLDHLAIQVREQHALWLARTNPSRRPRGRRQRRKKRPMRRRRPTIDPLDSTDELTAIRYITTALVTGRWRGECKNVGVTPV
jgi:hypothetical protein